MNVASRYNIYEVIHKALRARMSFTLIAIGRLDVDDAESVRDVVADVHTTLAMFSGHLASENEFVHAAIEARSPGATRRIAYEHVQHEEAIHALGEACEALAHGSEPQRQALADRLYAMFDHFVQENLVHMRYEEEHHNAALWAAYSDEEIRGIERSLVAAIQPEKMMLYLSSMIPAIPTRDRAKVLSGIRQSAPPEAFAGIYAAVLPLLDARSRERLALALDEAVQGQRELAA